jgi:hypothetical protein
MSKPLAIWIVGLALVLVPPCLRADDMKPATGRGIGVDQFVFGGSVRIDRPVPGDLIAAGGNVDVDAPVSGDAVLAGGNLRVSAAIGQDVYAAGGRLVVDAPVGGNVRIGGGQVEFGPKGAVAGNITVGGGQVSLRSAVKGSVRVGGGRVLIDAPIDGDVESAAGHLTLGPNARIGGALRYRSGEALERDPAAQVVGAIEALPLPGRGASAPAVRERGFAEHLGAGWGGPGWLWTLGLMAIAAVLVGALPVTSRRVADGWRTRPAWSLLLGFIALVCIPAAALILLISIVGIPLALLVLLLYPALLLVGYVASAVALGQWALVRWKVEAADRTNWRIASAMAAVLVLALLGSVPFVGGFVALLAMLAGIGAIAVLLVPRRGAVPGAASPAG